jgi:hypothetical protein
VLRSQLALLAVLACSHRGESPRVFAIDRPIDVGGQVLTPAMVKARVAVVNPPSHGGRIYCAYDAVGSDARAAYLWVLCEELSAGRDEVLSASSLPVVLDAGGVHTPRDGGLYVEDEARMFPAQLIPQLDLEPVAHNARVAALEAEIHRDVAAAGAPAAPTAPTIDAPAALPDAGVGARQGAMCATPEGEITRACEAGLMCCKPGGYLGQASTCETKKRCLELGQRP